MKFYEYLESVYLSKNLDLQVQYNPWTLAQTRAAQNLINAQRRVFIWLSYFQFPLFFILMRIGLMKEPKTAREIQEAYAPKTKDGSVEKVLSEPGIQGPAPGMAN